MKKEIKTLKRGLNQKEGRTRDQLNYWKRSSDGERETEGVRKKNCAKVKRETETERLCIRKSAALSLQCMILMARFQIHICTNGLMIKTNLNIFHSWLFSACQVNVIMSLLFHRWTCLTFIAHWKLVLKHRDDVDLVIKHGSLVAAQLTWSIRDVCMNT